MPSTRPMPDGFIPIYSIDPALNRGPRRRGFESRHHSPNNFFPLDAHIRMERGDFTRGGSQTAPVIARSAAFYFFFADPLGGVYPDLTAFFSASMPSSAERSGVVFTDLQAPPAATAMENAAAVASSGNCRITTRIVFPKCQPATHNASAQVLNRLGYNLDPILGILEHIRPRFRGVCHLHEIMGHWTLHSVRFWNSFPGMTDNIH